FSSRRRHTRSKRDWSSDVCSSDLDAALVSGATAFVAHNDLLAMGVLRRLAERGVAVPDQVSVVGYDDIFGADLCVPALTTLSGQIGRASCRERGAAEGRAAQRANG